VRKFVFSILFLITFDSLSAQYRLEGKVTNIEGELLEFAIVYIPTLNLSAGTDKSGNYRFDNLPAGDLEVECSYFGLEKITKKIILDKDLLLDFNLVGDLYDLKEVEIVSNINKITTFPGSGYMDKEALQKENMGQDVPILLQWQPSIITTSDAGAGIGYTSMRIRGVDQARINVTINDIPLNDAESQNVFWVDLPDMASTTENVKIQRGVGPSTNGAGAYGGTVALNTFGTTINPTVETNLNYGSFNTSKFNIKLNSGLIKTQYNIEARYSKIKSDGYVDRGASDLTSWYLELSKVNAKSSIRFITFEGKERTYQSWNGVPQALVIGDRAALLNHYYNNLGSIYKSAADSINLFNSSRTYNAYLYDNQVDDYTQTHSQLHYAHNFTSKITAKASLHYTRGKGFFEQYRTGDKLSNYGLPYIISNGDSITQANLVRRRWLDNNFYGLVSKVEYRFSDKQILSIGGGYNEYDGNHFGHILNVEGVIKNDFENYYEGRADKSDGNAYLRHEAVIKDKLNFSIDLQLRNVIYKVNGIDNDLRVLNHGFNYSFFNPKLALNYKLSERSILMSSFAIANREPDRSDLIDNPKNATPSAEKLLDYEVGYRMRANAFGLELNAYFMNYKNQLVLTGELNDVGSSIRTNVPKSSRLGIELIASARITSKLQWHANATLSKNKIANFLEIIYDYTNGFDIIKNDFKNTDIAFSPYLIGVNALIYSPVKNISFTISSKYIGRQYLDNTGDKTRSLSAYTFSNLLANFQPKLKKIKGISLNLQVNNLFNSLYSSNGYTYSYKYGELITENFLFPQAGINFMAGLSLKI
jgi:iron complex outermembrane recepter protein